MSDTLIQEVKLKDIGLDALYEYCLRLRNPIVITDIFTSLPNFKNWTMDYLVSKVGHKNVTVDISDDGVFTVDSKTGIPTYQSKTMDLKHYVEEMYQNNSKYKMYARKISILEQLPELKSDIKLIDYIPCNALRYINLWIGQGGNVSPLHFDYYNNYFIQLLGDKKMWLYSPQDFHHLYPNSWKSDAYSLSRINAESPNFVKYPSAAKATRIELTIPAGSILFLPSHWWHQVRSVNTGISLNIWCEPTLRQRFVFAYLHSMLNGAYNSIKSVFI